MEQDTGHGASGRQKGEHGPTQVSSSGASSTEVNMLRWDEERHGTNQAYSAYFAFLPDGPTLLLSLRKVRKRDSSKTRLARPRIHPMTNFNRHHIQKEKVINLIPKSTARIMGFNWRSKRQEQPTAESAAYATPPGFFTFRVLPSALLPETAPTAQSPPVTFQLVSPSSLFT